MNTLDTMKQALDALELIESAKDRGFGIDYAQGCAKSTIAALRQAISEAEQAEREPVAISDQMAYAFHNALTDGSIGESEVEKIKTGLRAAFANTAPPQRECKDCGAKQAEIDRLMLEFCPDEMTAEQLGEWAKHQKAEQAEKPLYRKVLREMLDAHELDIEKQEPVAYLCNGIRYKVIGGSSYGAIMGLPKRLVGQWVALVDATDSKHLQCTAPPKAEQEPVVDALQIASVALQDIACSSQTENILWWQQRARDAQKKISERLTDTAPQREWVSLTDEEIAELWNKGGMRDNINGYDFVRAIEAKLKEKNHAHDNA